MSLTPNRDAITKAMAEARRRDAELLARDDPEGIECRMAIEASEAVLGGVADLLDRAVAPEEVWPAVGWALARALSGFLMTATDGDTENAAEFLPGALASIDELVRARLREGAEAFAIGTAIQAHAPGHA